MRILVLNYEYPPLGGGAGNATHFLCGEWGKCGITVDIVTTWFTGLKISEKESENVTVHRVHSLRKRAEQSNPLEMMSYVRKCFLKAKDLCSNNKYDRIISFFAIPTGLAAHRLSLYTGIPYIVLLRGGDVPGFLPKQLKFFHAVTWFWTKKIWRRAERVIANSVGLQKLAQKTGSRIGVSVEMIPNGVDTEFFKPVQLPGTQPYTFLFVGRFSEQKNIFYLLDQFEKVMIDRNIKLILVGDGPEKRNIEKKVSSSDVLRGSVTLHPWSTKEKLLGYYQSAHCFVNPSLYEGLPNTVLEALACGLPVIASDIGGNNELVIHGENGFLFSLNELDCLKNVIEKIIGITAINNMGTFSRNSIVDRFSWMSAAKQILADRKL